MYKIVTTVALGLVLAWTSATRAADTYKVDSVHSTVLFRIQHLGVSYTYGRFDEPTGTFTVDEADLSKSSVEMQLQAGNIDTGNAKRDGHLKSPDFFNVKVFPTITFKSTAVKKSADNTYEITGDLTLHGVTKSVTLTMQHVGSAKSPMGDFRSGYEGTLVINRTDFGMSNMVGMVGDEVHLTISIEGVKQ